MAAQAAPGILPNGSAKILEMIRSGGRTPMGLPIRQLSGKNPLGGVENPLGAQGLPGEGETPGRNL